MPTTPRAGATSGRRRRLAAVGALLTAAAIVPAVPAAAGGLVSGRAAAACANTSLMPTAHDTAAVGAAIVCLVNATRAQYGLAPLSPNRALNTSAMGHSRDMVARDYFGHDSPSGRTPAQRMLSHGAPCANGCVVGENIAWATGGDSTPAAIVQAWMNSPGHRSNILDPEFRYEGLGVAEGSPNLSPTGQWSTTVTQDFDS